MVERLVLRGTNSNNTLDVSSALQPYEIYALKGNDTVFGTAFDDVIDGGPGHDKLFGGAGNDTFMVSGAADGQDFIDGGDGYDLILGDDGDTRLQLGRLTVGQSVEEINGGGGDNVVAGTAFNNFLDFSATRLVNVALIDADRGNDRVTGSAFDDLIKGGSGHDTLTGGGGIDTAVFSGSISGYQISVNADRVVVSDQVGGDGRDYLYNFSYLRFSDAIFDLTGGTGATPPEAQADTASGAEDSALTIDVLSNDSSPSGGVLRVDAVTQGANGSVVINPDSSVTYTPAADFFGTDSFTYTVSDSPLASATATVTVTVTPLPDPPVARDDEAVTTRDTPVSIDVLGNDSDPDGDSLTVAGFTQPTNGSVTGNADGTLRYTPDSGFAGNDSFTYSASDGSSARTASVSLQVVTTPPTGDNFRQILTSAPEDNWIRLNINHFQDVWTPFLHRANGGNQKPDAVIGAWSSMAWDSERGDLIFWGGGHANYPGNEVYRWRSSTLEWERASLPSEVVKIAGSHYEVIDGYLNAPISSHTYDNSEYLPIVDRFMVLGGAAFNTGGGFVRTDGVTPTGPYFWDPAKADGNKVGGTTGSHVNPQLFPEVVGGEMWENRDNLPATNLVNSTSAYAEEDGKDVIYFGRRDLWKYTVHDIDDPSKDTYEQVGRTWEPFGGDGAGAYSPDLNAFVRTAQFKFVMWDLDNAGPGNRNMSFVPDDPTDTFDFSLLADYGMDYDPVRDVFVLWGGDGMVWELAPPDDVSTTGWVLTPLDSGAVDQFPDTRTVGVLGKWKYVAEQDIYIGVNDSRNGDVWVYKPDDWQPENSLPQLAVANTTTLMQAQTGTPMLADLIDWSDDDGDILSFGFTDLNPAMDSGYLLLNGAVQPAGQEVVVSEEAFLLGDLVWIPGEGDTVDDVAVRVSDPFGFSPLATLHLPGDAGHASASLLAADAETLPGEPLNLADLVSAPDDDEAALSPAEVAQPDAQGTAVAGLGETRSGAPSDATDTSMTLPADGLEWQTLSSLEAAAAAAA